MVQSTCALHEDKSHGPSTEFRKISTVKATNILMQCMAVSSYQGADSREVPDIGGVRDGGKTRIKETGSLIINNTSL